MLFLLLIGLIYGLCYVITVWIPNKEQKKVDKEPKAKFKRIDPVDAWIDARTVMMKYKTKEVIDVQSELDKYLEMMKWKK